LSFYSRSPFIFSNDMREKIERRVEGFVREYPVQNRTCTEWDSPLVGFAGASDPLCAGLKGWVSETHILPGDLRADGRTVIVYFIPFNRKTVLSNQRGKRASVEWAAAYIETNRLLVELGQHLSAALEKEGFQSALVPPTHHFDKQRLVSNWSHRHLAWIAGLGTFGLNRMLITEKGCCGRLGSLVTNAIIEPKPRPKKEFCLFKYDGSCKKCVDRCAYGALKIDSYDRKRCYEVCLINAETHAPLGLADVCGKCVSGVPCSFKNPIRP
jgi:epoxyqueuosine reductase QueG